MMQGGGNMKNIDKAIVTSSALIVSCINPELVVPAVWVAILYCLFV